LQIKAANWPTADEIDTCNGDLVITITEVIAGNTIPTKNHLILPEIYLDSNPKTLENYGKKMGSFPFLSPVESLERKNERALAETVERGAGDPTLGPRQRRRERLSRGSKDI
jgi:hypothetical protein